MNAAEVISRIDWDKLHQHGLQDEEAIRIRRDMLEVLETAEANIDLPRKRVRVALAAAKLGKWELVMLVQALLET